MSSQLAAMQALAKLCLHRMLSPPHPQSGLMPFFSHLWPCAAPLQILRAPSAGMRPAASPHHLQAAGRSPSRNCS